MQPTLNTLTNKKETPMTTLNQTTTASTTATAKTSAKETKAKATKKTRNAPQPLNVLGKFFGSFRIYEGLTTEQWAEKVGSSAQLISKIERGEVDISANQAQRLLGALVAYPAYVDQFVAIVAQATGLVLISHLSDDKKAQVVALATGQLELAVEPVQA